VQNSIIYNCDWAGLQNVAGTGTDYNCLYGNTRHNYLDCSPSTHDLCQANNNSVDPLDGSPGNGIAALNYVTRIENGSNLDGAASNGGDIGATILKQIGVTGTLWGDPGYDTETDQNLWPFPYEGIIREHMRAYSYDGGNLSGNRGFCVDRMTLTDYIWGYLGHTPPDLYPPLRWGSIPADDSTNVAIDADIQLFLSDNGTGVDLASIVMTVEGFTVFNGSSPASYPHTTVTGDASDYLLSYNPPEDFGYSQQVEITVTAQDLANPPNIMATETYSFTTIPDTEPPYVADQNPSNGAENIPVNSNISFHIKDDETGVDVSSVIISVEDETVYDGANPAAFPHTSVTGNQFDYTFTHNPPGNFGYSQQIEIVVNALDLAHNPNILPIHHFSFITEPDLVAPLTSGHQPAKGSTNVASDTEISMHILDNETGVNIQSILMTVEGETVFDGVSPQFYPNATVTGDKWDYTINYNPPVKFGYSQQVDVTLTAKDLALNPNTMPTDAYFFTTQPDTKPPYTAGHDPAKQATNVPIDAQVSLHIKDDEKGVDLSTVVMLVEGEKVYDGADPSSYEDVSVNGNPADYQVVYTPPAPFNLSLQVDVSINASDLAATPNAMPTET